MPFSAQLAKHFRDVHFGGNWTSVNMKDVLKDVNQVQASFKKGRINSIFDLVYHIHYYVGVVTKVLKGEQLQGSDTISFHHPEIETESEWQEFLKKVWQDAETLASEIEKVPDDKLFDNFDPEGKYKTVYWNIQGIIEHTHYHLGQIVILKKMY